MRNNNVSQGIVAVSVFAGLLYAMKQKASLGKTALYMGAFGIGGLFLSNVISNINKD
ncbi:MAG: hypothetical protein LLF94_10865 [Chlamydiales bacterium]|nr:hypothetical protein [Chlamydiales bacterium]